MLGHEAHAALCDLVRRQSLNLLPGKQDSALRGRHDAAYALERGRLACSVAAQEGDQFAIADLQRDSLQYMALAVVSMQIFDMKDHALPPVIMLPR